MCGGEGEGGMFILVDYSHFAASKRSIHLAQLDRLAGDMRGCERQLSTLICLRHIHVVLLPNESIIKSQQYTNCYNNRVYCMYMHLPVHAWSWLDTYTYVKNNATNAMSQPQQLAIGKYD